MNSAWRKHLLLWVMCIGLAMQAMASHKTDSLWAALKAAKDDTNKVNTANLLASELINYEDLQSADSLLKVAVTISQSTGYKKGLSSALVLQGIILSSKGDFTNALDYQQKGLAIKQEINDRPGMAKTFKNVGIVYYQLGNMPQALDNFLKALDLFKAIGDKNGTAGSLVNVGIFYDDQKDFKNALDYYTQALNLAEAIGNKRIQSSVLLNIGIIYKEQEKYDTALSYYKKALGLFSIMDSKRNIAICHDNIGNVYQHQSNYTQALDEHHFALSIDEEIGDKESEAITYNDIATDFYGEKQYDQAIENASKGLELAKATSDLADIETSENTLYNLYNDKGDKAAALIHYQAYITARDSLYSESNTKKIVSEQMNYEFEKKQAAEKAEQAQKDALAASEKHRQDIITYAIAIGLLLVLVFSGLLFSRFKVTQKQKQVIEEQKTIVEEKNREVMDSIHYAERIQKALLASDDLLKENLHDYFVFFRPKDIVSGDFYWAIKQNSSFYLAVCDSTGHGVPGAFMSLLNISFLNEAITKEHISKPNEIFNHARKRLVENFSREGQQDGMDGILVQLNGTTLTYAAAYNAPIIIRNGKTIEMDADKIPVGPSPKENESFTLHQATLQKGDMVYLFTDGYADQFGGPDGKKFKYKKLMEQLSVISGQSIAEQKKALEQTFTNWKGSLEQVDDVLVIGIRV